MFYVSNTIDLISKVEWLRAHDELAIQIVINARNFCRSFLRLEDILCYSATALHAMGEIMASKESASAHIPFNAHKLSNQYIHPDLQ